MLTFSETIFFPVSTYLFRVDNKNTRQQCEIYPKLTKKDTRTTSIDINTQLIASCSAVSYFNFELVNVS